MRRQNTKSELYVAPAVIVQEICIRSCIAASLSGSTENLSDYQGSQFGSSDSYNEIDGNW